MTEKIMKFIDPIRGQNREFLLVPISLLDVSPYQRELSDGHVKNLIMSIEQVGFIDPLTVYEENGKLYVINGQHRFIALKTIIETTGENPEEIYVPVIKVPRETAKYVISLNIEKAPNIRDKSLEAKKIYEDLIVEKPEMTDYEVAMIIEPIVYATFGWAYEKDLKFIGSALFNLFKKIDLPLNVSIKEAINIRKHRADRLLSVKELFVKARNILVERGETDYLNGYNVVLSRVNPYKKMRAIMDDFDEAISKIKNNLVQLIEQYGESVDITEKQVSTVEFKGVGYKQAPSIQRKPVKQENQKNSVSPDAISKTDSSESEEENMFWSF